MLLFKIYISMHLFPACIFWHRYIQLFLHFSFLYSALLAGCKDASWTSCCEIDTCQLPKSSGKGFCNISLYISDCCANIESICPLSTGEGGVIDYLWCSMNGISNICCVKILLQFALDHCLLSN